MSKLTSFRDKEDASPYLRLTENQTVNIRIVTPEPEFCLPVWVQAEGGQRKKLNSISIDRNNQPTGFKCPLLPLHNSGSEYPDRAPGKEAVYGVFNYDVQKVQVWGITQRSIIRSLAGLEEQVAAMKPKKGRAPLTLCDFKICVSRIDSGGKTQYNVTFAPDAQEPLEDNEADIIKSALEDPGEDNIYYRVKRYTQWPSQEYLDKIGVDVQLPEGLGDEPLTDDSIPF